MHLVVIAGPDKGRTFELKPAEALRVGRSQSTPTRLSDPHVSRVHCEVRLDGGRVTLTDSKSAAGTFVNGQRVAEQVLKPGDVIRIGETQLRLEGAASEEPATVLPTGRAAAGPGKQLADLEGQTLAHYHLNRVLATGQTGLVFLARDVKKDMVVALKVLKPEISQN